jgi:hypothetical protein
MTRIIIALVAFLVVAVGGVTALVMFSKRDANTVASGGGVSVSTSDSAAISKKSTFDADNAYEPGQLLVIDPPQNFTQVLQQQNFTLIDRYTFQGLGFGVARVRIPKGMSIPQARGQLAQAMPGVTIDYNRQFDASADAPRRPGQDSGSALDQLKQKRGGAEKGKILSFAQSLMGWENLPATCGKGIKIGMIDSVVDTGHPVLKDRAIEARSFHDPERKPGDADHGTAVAALLIGKPTEQGLGGLLPGATLKAANMFEKNEAGNMVGNSLALVRGLDWLVREKVSVVNMSIAGLRDAAVERAVRAASSQGVIIVAAAGNWGHDAKPAYPAAFDEAVGVTAIDTYEGLYDLANTGPYVAFAAPGVNVLTAAPGGGSKNQSGTSFAAPFLTAVIAMENARAGGGKAGIENRLTKTVKDLGAKGRDPSFGWGEVKVTPFCGA